MDCVAHVPPTQLGIRVNAVRPEIFATRRPQRMARPNRAEQIAPQLPMRRAGSAEEVGEAMSGCRRSVGASRRVRRRGDPPSGGAAFVSIAIVAAFVATAPSHAPANLGFQKAAMNDDSITYRGTVYPWQRDHMGHMNVMWYVSKFDEAIWNLFASVGLRPSYLRESGRGMAAVEQRIRYLRELVAGDVVAVRSEITAVREKVVEVRQTLVNLEDRAVAATMDLVGVHLDTVARRSVPFETRIAERARALLAAAPEGAVRR